MCIRDRCTSPCTLQKTKRGDFCIYNPGNIETVPNDVLSNITKYSSLNKCGYIFVRIFPRGYGVYGWYQREYEPDLYRERFKYSVSEIYVPSILCNDIQANYLFEKIKEVFKKSSKNKKMTYLTNILKRDTPWSEWVESSEDEFFENEDYTERPLRNEIKLDDTADDWYNSMQGESTKDKESLKNEILSAIHTWATRFKFKIESEQQEEHIRYGMLICIKACKTFDNFKAASKLFA